MIGVIFVLIGRKAWEVLRGIGYGPRTISKAYEGDPYEDNNDCKIIAIARAASDEYHCRVEIITDDTDYSAYLKGDDSVSALHLREYMVTKQALINMIKLARINEYYADSYDDIEAPTQEEANAYLPDGNTLIISAVRNRKYSFLKRKAKILWLIRHRADVNKRDCSRRYFPPISHAIQAGEYDMFIFHLEECHADPNIGSRNPFDAGLLRQKNEGNMPLMIAAWHGRVEFVKALLRDERTSINQQDGNGYTALMKASGNGWNACINILKDAGADQKIVDIDGKTAAILYDECLEKGKLKDRHSHNGNRGPNRRGYRK